MLAIFALLAVLSLAQGVVDVVVPSIRGTAPFGLLFAWTARFGPAFLIAYLFVHNLGLACLVPGFGFFAARFERNPRNRGVIAVLLLGAVIVTLGVAALYMIRAPERFDLTVSIPLFAGEVASVLALGVTAAMELRTFIPTRRVSWSLVTPLRAVGLAALVVASLLLLLATVEARAVLH